MAPESPAAPPRNGRRELPTLLAGTPLPPKISPRHLNKLEKALRLVLAPYREHDPAFLIWVSGGSGVGKSTLLAAVRERLAGQEIEFLAAEAFPHVAEILEPALVAARDLIARVRARAAGGDESWSRTWREILERHTPALFRVLPEIDWGEPVDPYPDLDPVHERARLIDHLAGLFLRVAERTPLVLEIEGGEHLDALTRELLLSLARVVRTRRQGQRAELPLPPPPRLAVILTTEREDAPPLPLGDAEVFPLTLHGLGRDELTKLLEQEYREVPLSIREKIFHACRGNPLDVQLRVVRERATRDRSGAAAARRLLEFGAFEVECATSARSLPEPAQRLLHALALIEKAASPGILRGVLDSDEKSLAETLERLERDGWIAAVASGGVRLRHERVGAALRHGLSHEEALRLHRRLAETIEREYEGRAYRRFQEVYHHYSHSTHDAAVVEAGFLAAAEALRLYDFEGATRIYRRLLEHAREIPPERLAQGISTLAELLDRTPPGDESLLHFVEEVLSEHERNLPAERAAALWRRLGKVAGELNLAGHELPAYDRALELLDGAGPSSERMLVFASIARSFLRRRQYDQTLSYCREGLELSELYRLREDRDFLELCRVAEDAHFHRGEMVEALAFEEKYLRLARVEGSPVDVLDSLLRLAYLRESQGQASLAEGSLQEALPVAHSTGSRILEAKVDERLGFFHLRQEDWIRAKEAFQRALEVHTEVGDESRAIRIFGALGMVSLFTGDVEAGARSFRLYALYLSARARPELAPQVPGIPCDYRSRGERDEEIRIREESIARARGDHPQQLLDALSELADLRRDCGEFEVARGTLRRGLRIASGSGLESARFHLQLGALYRAQGEMDLALTSLQDGLESMRDLAAHRDWIAEFNVQVGLVWLVKSNYERALMYLLRGLRSYLELEHENGVTHALLQLAELLRRLGRSAAAEDLALAALALADTLDIDRLEAEAWLLLAALRGNGSGQTSGHQEVGIAREIMNRLGILEGRCRALLVEAGIFQRYGDAARVFSLCTEALEIGRDLGLRPLLAEGLILRGRLEGDRRTRGGDFVRALGTLETALEHIRGLGDRDLEVTARAALAVLYERRDRGGAAAGELKRICELLAELLRNCPAAFHASFLGARPVSQILRQAALDPAAPQAQIPA